MTDPPHAPRPEDQRRSWYTPAPEATGQPPPGQSSWTHQPGPAHPPAPAPVQPPGLGSSVPESDRKLHSPALATVGWVLTILFGLLFLVLFFAGVDSFNSNVTAGENAYNVGLFLGFLLILLIPAVPILLGIRLIRQPRRQRRLR